MPTLRIFICSYCSLEGGPRSTAGGYQMGGLNLYPGLSNLTSSVKFVVREIKGVN